MFVLDKTADQNGCGFMDYVTPKPTLDQLKQLFGNPEWNCEPEKGYNYEYRFRSDENITVVLYDRYGVWRIGCLDDVTATRFKAWIGRQLTPAG